VIVVAIADWMTANTKNTAIFASRYALVDRPTACSRRKMGRLPMRSRIVNAVPMKTAAMVSNINTEPGPSFAYISGISGSTSPRPTRHLSQSRICVLSEHQRFVLHASCIYKPHPLMFAAPGYLIRHAIQERQGGCWEIPE